MRGTVLAEPINLKPKYWEPATGVAHRQNDVEATRWRSSWLVEEVPGMRLQASRSVQIEKKKKQCLMPQTVLASLGSRSAGMELRIVVCEFQLPSSSFVYLFSQDQIYHIEGINL